MSETVRLGRLLGSFGATIFLELLSDLSGTVPVEIFDFVVGLRIFCRRFTMSNVLNTIMIANGMEL